MKESDIIQNIKSKFGIESINAMQRTMADEFRRQDIMLLSPTGSGKTIAFAIYLIKNLKEPCGRVQAVVIAPSRELTVQIYKVIQAISSEYKTTCCYGGHNFEDEKNSLNATPDIIISTPGRLLDHLTRGDIDIRPVRILILDEFDKSLELGFQDEMRKIIRRMPNISRRVLTSATKLATTPDFIDLSGASILDFLKENATETRLKIIEVKSDLKDKLKALGNLLYSLGEEKSIVFANHRESVERIFNYLKEKGFPAGIYHGGLEQIEREKAVALFNNGTISILVTTDLGSRGLDIADVKHIIHYHIPVSAETYTHRNGRTARVSATGSVYVITGPEEKMPEFIKFDETITLDKVHNIEIKKEYETLFFSAGKKEKLSKGDILGFLIAKGNLNAQEIGKIDVADHYALAAIPANKASDILKMIRREKIKNKRVKISMVRQ